MSRALIILNQSNRRAAVQLIQQAPNGTRVEFRGARRSIPQNDKLWAMLTEVAAQLPWYGERLRAEDWKVLFMDALNKETRTVPSLVGAAPVNIGRGSSSLSKEEFSDLIELIHAFGAQNGVVFRDSGTAPRPKVHQMRRSQKNERTQGQTDLGKYGLP